VLATIRRSSLEQVWSVRAAMVRELAELLDNDGLTGLVDDLLPAVPRPRLRPLLLVVDQSEVLLTPTGREDRTRFAELLRDALAGPVHAVATLRPEFLDRLLTSPELSTLPARTHALRPLRPLRPEVLRAVTPVALDAGHFPGTAGSARASPMLPSSNMSPRFWNCLNACSTKSSGMPGGRPRCTAAAVTGRSVQAR
jgi:hypothetical protein